MYSLLPYPRYKRCNIPWMVDIPEHWDTSRGKFCFEKVNRSVSDSDEVVTCFRDGTVTLRKNRRLSGFTEALKEIGYQGIRVGDLVIHAMDAFAGAVGVSDSNGKGSPVYSVCTPYNSVEPKYYAHLIREMARNKWILALSTGIRERSTDFRFETFGTQVLPLPPIDEQQAIVKYLDYVDKRVKKYIRAKQKQIKLLEEMKQAIIHQAVTRGLDPTVPLKPSGVEWLGDVPEHWETTRGKVLFRKINRPVNETDDVVTCFRDGEVTLRKNRRVRGFTEALKEIGYQGIRKGDLVIHAMDAFAGAIGVSDSNGKGSPVYSVCIPIADVDPKYFASLLREMARNKWLIALSKGIRERSTDFRFGDFGNQYFSFPPKYEQNTITEYLDEFVKKFNKSISVARGKIELVQEYRNRLIADFVTGKLDVREAASKLPDELEELFEEPDEAFEEDLENGEEMEEAIPEEE